MNHRITSPLMVTFINKVPSNQQARLTVSNNELSIPVNTQWADFKQIVESSLKDPYFDGVIVGNANDLAVLDEDVMKSTDIKLGLINKLASSNKKPVLNQFDDQWYLLNPAYDAKGHTYAPSDEDILGKFHSFPSENDWQVHQASNWKKFQSMMPLLEGDYHNAPLHVSELTSASRGLEKDDLKDFFSWRSNKPVMPSLMNDDMVGMPGIAAKQFEGYSLVTKDGIETPIRPINLKTIGMPGFMIPMKNVDGVSAKYQVSTDVSKINVHLKATTKDNVSIQSSEYYDKKADKYLFNLNGGPSGLHVLSANPSGIQFKDVEGVFNVSMKQDVKPLLVNRGYDIPEIVDRINVSPRAKYIWPSKGTMIGSTDVAKTVSPSNAGFVVAKESPNNEYVVVIAEGALKGVIAAKHMDTKDASGVSMADVIAKNRGVIVAQVPGVSPAFIESVKPVYEKYNVVGTYVAMDADGRENLAVAKGIHKAEEILSPMSPVKVLSWNPVYKGIDDSLLEVSKGKLLVNNLGLTYGSPEKLFPLDKAEAPNPYKLDGTRANRVTWDKEYEVSKHATNDAIAQAQNQTKDLAVEEAIKSLLGNEGDFKAELERLNKVSAQMLDDLNPSV